MNSVYGPVSSWRLGRSLGIDPICSEEKICSFDCVYCQLGSRKAVCERKEFITLEKLREDLKAIKGVKADVITFSGTGEPTLAKNLEEMMSLVRTEASLPIAILTNSSCLSFEEVRKTLCKADVVVAKLDAPNEEVFQKINRPCKGMHFKEYLEGMKTFREEYYGKFALQIMFVEENKAYAAQLAELAKDLKPSEAQVNTPLRPSPVKALSREEIGVVKKAFSDLGSVKCVYDETKPAVEPIDLEEVRKRKRPNP